jgi:hypothetical protein
MERAVSMAAGQVGNAAGRRLDELEPVDDGALLG